MTVCFTRTNSLNLLALRGLDVFPVPHSNRVSNDEGDIHHGILDTDAPVGSASKDEVVPRAGLSGAIWI